LDLEQEAISKQPSDKPKVHINETNLAYAIYTSGSTGKRKAAQIEHRGLTNQRFAWKDALQISENDITLQTAPFSFDVFTADWVKALTCGAKMVINPKNVVLEPDDNKTGEFIYNLLIDNKITAIDVTPPVLRKLLRFVRDFKKDLNFLRLIVVGCDAWYMSEYRELVEFTKGNTRIVNSYGMTEGTVDSTYYEGYGDENGDSTSMIGKPYTNNEVYILDDDGNVASVGEVGELCITGPTLTRGYLNRTDLNAEKFGELIFPDGSKKRIYKSGDIAKYRPDGNLEFLGRKDSQIEIGGIRVEIGEIEKLIQKHPAVQENAVIATYDNEHKIKLTCFTVKNIGHDLYSDELKQFLADKMPYFMIPTNILILDTMPLSMTGKIDRKKLASIAESENIETIINTDK
jgi:amino acid adenylation domain-containing protein